ncbi:hypothetical protein CS006_10005 [Bifidobacterium primatium]|uniref:Uncharacterized protein n=2 Tax=Bifidobacterium primatium TaxID=2045438 RepID=A0A2M9H6N1_9BIFI|nr:hypothetical protein CS006_10005 [Bifidobacterium primatium]
MDEMMVSRIDIFRFVADRFFAAVPAKSAKTVTSAKFASVKSMPAKSMMHAVASPAAKHVSAAAPSPRTIHVTVTMPADDVAEESSVAAGSMVK